jgi:hypothetical protein
LDRNGDAAIRQNVLSPVFFSLLRLQEYLKPHFFGDDYAVSAPVSVTSFTLLFLSP